MIRFLLWQLPVIEILFVIELSFEIFNQKVVLLYIDLLRSIESKEFHLKLLSHPFNAVLSRRIQVRLAKIRYIS